MGSLASFQAVRRPSSFHALSIHTKNYVLPTFNSPNANLRLRKKNQTPFLVFAENKNNNNNGGNTEKQQEQTNSSTKKKNAFWPNLRTRQETPAREVEKDERSNSFWDSFAEGNGGDLEDIGPIKIGLSDLLDPDPQNMLALGLIGLLTWATAQICWQLFFVSLAIAVAAVKYSLIAAILLFILVTLL